MFRPVSTNIHAQQHTLLVVSSSSSSASSSSLKAIVVLMVSVLLLSSSSSFFFSSTTTRISNTGIRPCQSFSYPFAVAYMSTTTSTTASRSTTRSRSNHNTNSNSKLTAFKPKLRSRSGNNSKSRNNDKSNFHTHYRVTSIGSFINSNTDTTNINVEEPTTTTPTASNALTTANNISNSNSNNNDNDNTNTNTNQNKMKVKELKPTISTPTPTTISNAADTDADTDANTDANTDTDISDTTPTKSNQVEEMGNSQNRHTDHDTDKDNSNNNSNSNTNENNNENKKFRLSNRILHTLDPCVVKTKGWIQQYAHLWKEENDNKNPNRIDDHQGIFSLAQGVVYWKPPPACHSALQEAVRSTLSLNEDDDNRNSSSNVNVKDTISAATADSDAVVKGGDSTTITTTTTTTMMQRIVSRFLLLSVRVRQTSVGRAMTRLVMHGKRLLLLGRNERPILRETETRTTPPTVTTVTTVTATASTTAPTNTKETTRSDNDEDGDDGDTKKKNRENDLFSLHAYGPERGIPELVTALKDKIRIEHQMIEHDVTVTVGANQAYTNVVLTIMGNDDNNINDRKNQVTNTNKAVVFAPYYFNHVMALQMCCGPDAVIVGPTDMTTGIPDLDWLTQVLKDNKTNNDNYHNNNIRMVTVVNPGNPTGIALEYDYVQKMVDLCQHYGVWLVLDCTYEHFFNHHNNNNNKNHDNDDNTNNRKKKSSGSVLPTFPNDPHVIHLFSFSKGYSLAGYRCGYVVTHQHNPNGNSSGSGSSNSSSGGGSDFLRHMLKVQDTIPIGPPRISQHVAVGALTQGMKKKKKNNDDDDDNNGRTGSSSSSSSSLYYSAASKAWVTAKYATLDQSRHSILTALSSLPQTLGGSGSMYVMGKLPENLLLSITSTMNDNDNDNDNDNNNTDNNNEHNNSNSIETDEEPIDVHFCRVLIRDYGIAIIPGSFCGLEGWVRICYANLSPTQTLVASQRLQKGIQELTGVVAKEGANEKKENE